MATLAVVFATGGLVASLVAVLKEVPRQRRKTGATIVESRLKEALREVDRDLEQEQSLEDELAKVSGSLTENVQRLRRVSEKAEAFEAEVRDLVQRAEAATAAAKLHEEDARRISLLLGEETERRLRAELDDLAEKHRAEIDKLRRVGIYTAVWTFVGGVSLGVLGNIVVAWFMG